MPATAIASSACGTAGSRSRLPRPERLLLSLLLAAAPVAGQQVPDTAFRPPITHPAHPAGRGPLIAVDGAHHNFHTAGGRYAPFAALLARDGYQVVPLATPFTDAALAPVRLLVVANALAAANETSWVNPVLPAFTPVEVATVRRWVEGGGALLLIADHMPFGGAAATLGEAFGFRLANAFALDSAGGDLAPFTRAAGTLADHPVTLGRGPGERVEQVQTFTGQAFPLPAGAAPLLLLPPGSRQLYPDTAWAFSPATRVEPAGGLAQGALLQVGRGRVAVFGEAAMFSAQLAGPTRRPVGMNAPAAIGNATLLRNLVRWLTTAP
ncbi:MAG: hypothetical protein KA180_05085 [Gemmatimonadales bacterium]|nr:hypothetical protein [Gemmatimonadales bacterium]